MQPGLHISRSIGDLICHKIGVTSEPEIRIHEILQHDKFIVAGTQSIWNHVGPEDVIEAVIDSEQHEFLDAAEKVNQRILETA